MYVLRSTYHELVQMVVSCAKISKSPPAWYRIHNMWILSRWFFFYCSGHLCILNTSGARTRICFSIGWREINIIVKLYNKNAGQLFFRWLKIPTIPHTSFSSISSLYRELLVSKGNGKRRVEVVAAEMLVVMFLVEFQVFRVWLVTSTSIACLKSLDSGFPFIFGWCTWNNRHTLSDGK